MTIEKCDVSKVDWSKFKKDVMEYANAIKNNAGTSYESKSSALHAVATVAARLGWNLKDCGRETTDQIYKDVRKMIDEEI